ncbi:MAG: alpha/beta hydrolase, partial [Pseudomonadota bacterium]
RPPGQGTAAALTDAPLLSDLAEGPQGGAAHWLQTSDAQRIRIGIWPAQGTAQGTGRGTLLLFPGRTEYIEKYGRFAHPVTRAGLSMLAVDWRGQGLADRPPHRWDMGHVETFDEYQRDVASIVQAAEALDLPQPWYLLGHSMGGAIGLRALHNGLSVERAVFTAPMWGILMSPGSRLAAGFLSRLSQRLGLDKRFTPSMGPAAAMPFAANPLTHDRETFEYFEGQVAKRPELNLGGPSVRWLIEALKETAELVSLKAPAVPALTYLGSQEAIVDPARIRDRMASWPGGKLEVVEGARHEVLMERPEIRERVIQGALSWCLDENGKS